MEYFFDDTIIAPATIPGTGAISILRISGDKALALADTLINFRHGDAVSAQGNSVKFGIIEQADGSVLDEVLCCLYRAPHSYTGENSVEIMCHASMFIVSSILEMAVQNGARIAKPGEFTQRAFLSGKMDLTQAEAVADVISASSSSAHKLAFQQLKGGISKELNGLRDQLLQMASLLELELDFSEEDVEFADRERLDKLLCTTIDHISSLTSSFHLGNAIKNGVPVAIAGPANAGKSTLLNSILGEQRSIVSDIAGTTRDTVEECFNSDGILFRLVDTAGIREMDGNDSDEGIIEKIGMERSFQSIKKADIIVLVTDVCLFDLENKLTATTSSSTSSQSDIALPEDIKQILEVIDFSSQKLIIALNKCDKLDKTVENKIVNVKNSFVSIIDNEYLNHNIQNFSIDILEMCAKRGNGIETLLQTMVSHEKERLKEGSGESEIITNARHFEALCTARNYLSKVRDSLRLGTPSDLAAEDLRAALSSLASITGEISTNEVLGEIFGKFCIGK